MRSLLAVIVTFALAGLCLRPVVAASPFQVTEKVQGSGASSSEAFNAAVDTGRHKAWVDLVHRLTPQNEWAQLATIDAASLQHMVRNYQIADEARSTTRYVATITYVFNEPLVRRYFRNNNVAYSLAKASPMLVVPMDPSYAPDSPWAQAWSTIAVAGGVVPLILPQADPLNRAALAPVAFATAGWSDVAPAAERAQAGEAAVVQAGPGRQGHLAVGIRILSPNQPSQSLTPLDVPVPANATPAQAYGLAAQAAAAAIGQAWTTHNAVDFGRRSTLTVNIMIPSLGAWGAMEQRLGKLPVVEAVRVDAIEIGQLQADIDYAGTQAQLGDFLTQAGFSLENRNGDWWLGPVPPSAATDTR